MPKSSASQINNLPYSNVLLILLDSLRPALLARSISLGADDARDLAAALLDGREYEPAAMLDATVAKLVEARLLLLRESWGLDFATALRSDLADIGSWQSTAEFLELANAKAEAETQIALGSALLAALGRHEYANNLLDLIAFDAGEDDVDTQIAKRVLLRVSGVDGADTDWLAQIKRWLADSPRT